ncbi:hypothetical protein BHE74_00039179 [Ensete ventricosum]|nr:hypothetical protein BHE74_00039179 [Ensete ventricosum]RZS23728.1 hypothetical protein BHM03_00056702 [Ensete ventricosum]
MWTGRYRAVPLKSTVDGRLKKKKGKEEEEKKKEERSTAAVLACALPAKHRRPRATIVLAQGDVDLRVVTARGSHARRRHPWATIVPARGATVTLISKH